ncbi:hypothetical protein SADUNF_Sadunf02G0079100 [Salix dunnii]|uniref:Uncharacterized protein n=1 Tax=Salix dunnii TaxID=1413687 RepID=A0A835TGX8_9ROSI|nr:hypothetical protein SADUNF_Sadunf02G0079100 [Salix dunnii]
MTGAHFYACVGLFRVFTVSGVLDSFIYHGQKAIKKKMEIEADNGLLPEVACYLQLSSISAPKLKT